MVEISNIGMSGVVKQKGNWLMNSLYDTEENDERFQFRGAHVQEVYAYVFLFRTNVNYSTDRDVLQDLSSSGIQRALPSQESNLSLVQRLDHGALYLYGQYLQPLSDGGDQYVSTVARNRTPVCQSWTYWGVLWCCQQIRRLYIFGGKKGLR